MALSLEFTAFDVDCGGDFVKITDVGTRTTLMFFGCGCFGDACSEDAVNFVPPIITTTSNRVEIFFSSDGSDTNPGWSLNWRLGNFDFSN